MRLVGTCQISKRKTLDRPACTSLSIVNHATGLSSYDTMKKCSLNRQSVGQRRRWESNPLETALQTVALPSGSGAKIKECPRQESNLVYDLRRVACCPSHSKDFLNFITPPRNRTSPDCFEGSHASSTLAGHFIKEPTTGFAPA